MGSEPLGCGNDKHLGEAEVIAFGASSPENSLKTVILMTRAPKRMGPAAFVP